MLNFSDSELIQKYLKGEQSALEELIGRYFRQVFLFAKTFVKNDSEAEDITQEVFVKVWKHLKKFDRERKFKTWLFQITKNTALDFLRKQKKFVEAANISEEQMEFSLDKLEDLSPLPEEIFDSNNFEFRLRELINSLAPPQKQVLSLHLLDNLTFEEISQILEEPLNTVKSRYRRSLLEIRKNLNAP